MGVRLIIRPRAGRVAAEANYEFDQSRIVIGRGAAADVRLPHPSVSHVHAVIREQGVGYVLLDEGSANGTRVNGQAVVRGRPKPLRDGDRIAVGAFVARFHAGLAVPESTSADGTAALARHLVRALWDEAGDAVPRLLVAEGPDEGEVLSLSRRPGRVVVGRDDGCDLVLHDPDVSREHVAITHDDTGARVVDLDSKNGMRVNDRATTDRPLRHGDQIHIGASLLTFEDPAEAHLRAIEAAADTSLDPNEEEPADPFDTAEPDAPQPMVPPPAPRHVVPASPRTGRTDVIIYLLAASVFALSLAGLLLLLRG
jgi:pSer/pThr/pTyr-binding forkhead associated (FHA) protein